MRAILLASLLGGCGNATRQAPPQIALPFPADTSRAEFVRPGVVHRFIYAPSGPWAIHVLDVDLTRCVSAVAVKGAKGAVGREKTSTMLRGLANNSEVIGGVNADFFLFTPPGVPTGALVTNSKIVTGPGPQPVFFVDARGRPGIATLDVRGEVTIGGRRFEIDGWNRAAPRGLAVFDSSWGVTTDTATSAIEVIVMQSPNAQQVSAVDTLPKGVTIPANGSVLIAGRNAPDSIRAALRALRPVETIRASVRLSPTHPREAVGGRPILARDSVIGPTVDTEGQTGFANTRHPRTAVGIVGRGSRLLLVTVDGRQPNYSAGMTLRELADLMLALGARDALNLDGGGSTTFVYADPDSARTLRVGNRPSDPTGERPVGNALAIVASCSR